MGLKQHTETVNENVEVKEGGMWGIVEGWVLSNWGEFSGRRQLLGAARGLLRSWALLLIDDCD